MKYSQLLIPTLREAPKDADVISAKLMIRAGMIRKIASGLYDWLPLGMRILKKVEQIIREEMNAIGGQEVWLPHIQPKELWQETERWQIYGKELLRIKDRKGSEFCFAPTAEEVVTDLVRRDVRSYRQLPVMLYQFGTKFRDEIRPRFGIMRAREFYMKDAYSFHADEKDAENYYVKVYDAYSKIFDRCGLKSRPVEAETGAIGGSFSHEFMVLAETGEEEVAFCSAECGFAANVERAECADSQKSEVRSQKSEEFKPLEEVPTPNLWTVEDIAKLLNQPKEKFIKTLFYVADSLPVIVLIRGDCELNEAKLLHVLNALKDESASPPAKMIEKMSEQDYAKLADCDVGFAGPVGLKDRCQKHDARCKIVADFLVRHVVNGVSGANKKDFHLKNINLERDYRPDSFADLRKVKNGDLCPTCAGKDIKTPLSFTRGIEVGHTFKLGTKYSKAMNACYLDESGQSHPFVMGCYGIGVSRIAAAAIEQSHDENGIIWPKELAPYQVIIVPVKFDESQTKEWSTKIYEELVGMGLDVLLDDRPDRAGIKFKDADLIGIPLRITVSEKGISNGTVEVLYRAGNKVVHVPREKIVEEVKSFLKSSLQPE